jgi:octaprenyl-diphosphate synthase
MDQLRAVVAEDMAAIDALIRQRLSSDVVLIREVAEYIIASGGKRLRPALVVLSARACGYAGEAHHEVAAVVEFIHTATLLHDDVVDESDLRRGRKTANAAFGNAASVLVGDFLYSRAFQMMVTVNNMQVMQVMAEATNTIAEGEVLQLLNMHNADTTVEAYLEVIRRKTAKLFEAAGRLGAILAGATPAIEQGLAEYGVHMGSAFQLVDDVLDYSGDREMMGKNVGDDLNEGKPTLPLIYAMQHGSVDDAAAIRRAIESGGRDDLPRVLTALENTKALDVARNQARQEAVQARAAIVALPDSKWKQTLLELTVFATERSF